MYKILINIPFVLYVVFNIIMIFVIGFTPVLSHIILNTILLFAIGLNFSLDIKKYNILGLIFLIVYTIINVILGYFDYLKWASSYISVFVMLYYLLVFTINRAHR